MSTDLQKAPQNLINYTDDQIKLIKSQVAPKATNEELKLFLYQCQRTGLDPLARQIYAIHRWTRDGDKMTVQTSIDGFRVIAERSGSYGGQSEPEFEYRNEKLHCCKKRVYKFNGTIRYEAAVGVAFWDEYVQLGKDQKPSGLWAKMPHTMLAKVAEALALRQAFPHDLSGLYTGDEMDQTEAPVVTEDVKHEVVQVAVKTPEELKKEAQKLLDDISKCTTQKALVKLYNDNKAVVDADTAVQGAMKLRKLHIENSTKQPA